MKSIDLKTTFLISKNFQLFQKLENREKWIEMEGEIHYLFILF